MKTRYLLQEKKKAKCTSTHALRLSTFSTRKAIGALFVFLLAFVACLPMQAQAADTAEKINIPDGYEQNVEWSRLSGDNRLDTMASISKSGFDKADTVVVAAAGNFPDALSATSLAGYYKCPVLLTDSNGLSQQTQSEINRLGVKKAIVAGGSYAISNNVVTSIEKMGIKVERLFGSTRLETAEKIYNSLDSSQWSQTAIVASGETFADALSISPYTYAYKAPIFLTDGSGSLTDTSSKILTSGKFSQVVIVGGTARISASTENAIKTKVGADNVIRLAGETRYDTSKEIVSWCVNNGLTYEGLSIAKGGDFPDALSGGALCGIRESVVMLVSENESDYSKVVSTLSDNKLIIRQANVLGGNAAVSTNLYKKLQESTLSKITNSTDQTDSKGIAEVTNKDGQTAVVTVSYDKDGNGNFITLSQVTVNANGDGTYTLDLPRCAKGKSVKANFVDKQTSKPITGAQVYVNDSGTNSRGSVNTDRQGNVSFEGSSGVTGKDGITEVVDINGNTIKATVTYDKDDNGTYVAVAGAKVTANDDGTYSIGIPDIAKAKDVKVNLENRTTGKPVADGTKVGATDSDGTKRVDGQTKDGEVVFYKNSGTTDKDGKTDVEDKDGNKTQVLVEYDKDGDGTYVALPGATVTANDDGTFDIDLPQDAKGKDVKSTLTNKETAKPVADGTQVSAQDYDGNNRDTGQTSQGVVVFDKNSGVTDKDGKTDVVGKSDKMAEATVTYDKEGDGNYVPLPGVTVTYSSNDGTYTLELPEEAKGKDVKAHLEEKETGNPITDTTASAIEATGAVRSTGVTDQNGDVDFPVSSSITDKDGNAQVTDKDGNVTKAHVEYDKNNDGNFEPLAGAKIAVNLDGSYSIDLPDTAKGKDVKAKFVDQKDNPVEDGTNVSATDADGMKRADDQTKDGEVFFDKNSGTTDKDGKTDVTDEDGNTTKVTVTYDKDGDGDPEEPLAGAKVTVNDDGTFDVEIPEVAKGTNVKVKLEDKDNNPVADGTKVSATNSDGTIRGTGETKQGEVIFDKNSGVTDKDGKTDVTDKDGKTTDALVEYDKDGNGNYVPLAGAKVTANDDGTFDVDLPQDAKGKDVKVTLTDAKSGEPVADGTQVSATDKDGNNRGTGETKDGVVVFDKNTGVTDKDGKTDVAGKYDKLAEATVTYDKGGDGTYVALPGVSVTYNSDDDTYTLELPEEAKDKNVKAHLEYKDFADPITNTTAIAVEATGAIRTTGVTDQNGDVDFPVSSSITDKDGNAQVTDKDGNVTKAHVEYDKNNDGNFEPLAGAKIAVNLDGSYSIDLPDTAKGKDVKAKFVDQKDNPVEDGTNVSATDADGMKRADDQTKDGEVFFDKNSGTTDKDGKTDVTDEDGNTTKVTVTYDKDGDGDPEEPLAGAKVTVNDDGTFDVEIPEVAKGTNVKVKLEDKDNNPVADGTKVSATNSDGTIRGTGETKQGEVIFDKNSGVTDKDGKTDVTDKDGKTTDALVEYDKDGNGNYVPLAGAKVTANDDGTFDVDLPQDAKGKDVKVTLTDAKSGEPVADGTQVSATDKDGNNRGTGETKDGVVVFDKNTGVTDKDGKTDIVDKDGNTIEANVYYDKDGDGKMDDPLMGAKVTANDDATFSVEIPEEAKDKNVKVDLKNATTKEPVADGTKVSASDSDGANRGTGQTEQGTVVFLGNSGITDKEGETIIPNPDPDPDPTKGETSLVKATVTYREEGQSYQPLQGARVEGRVDGGFALRLTEPAKCKDVQIKLQYVNTTGVVVSDFGAGTNVYATDYDSNYRGCEQTDSTGVATFLKNKGVTDKDKGQTDISGKDGNVIEVTVTYDKDGDGNFVPLPDTTVIYDKDSDTYKIDLPEAANGKDVKATLVDDTTGDPVADGTLVSATDASGNSRGTGQTKDGEVTFAKNSGTTDKDGKTDVTDKDGNTTNALVEYDENGDGNYVPLPGAKVTANDDGTFSVDLPDSAKGKDVKVTLTDAQTGDPVKEGTEVFASDSDGVKRADGKTDSEGVVYFDKNSGTTDKDGKTEVTDDEGNTTNALVEYDKGDGVYVPLPGATVTANNDGTFSVDLPDSAKGKDVKVTLTDAKSGDPVADGTKVSAKDYDGNNRGTGQTKDGVVYFDKNSGTTGDDGKTDVVDGDNKTLVSVLVECSDTEDNWQAVSQATVEAKEDGSYFIEIPESATGKNVKATLINKKTQKPMGSGISVSAIDAKSVLHGPELTNTLGEVIFKKSSGTTDGGGQTEIPNPDPNPNPDKGETSRIRATIYYDVDNTGVFSAPLAGAKVDGLEDGSFAIELPQSAKAKSVQITLEYVDESSTHVSYVAQKQVSVTDYDTNYRGQKTTNDLGVVVFLNSEGETKDDDGKTDVVDQSTDELVSVKVEVRNPDTRDYEPLGGAKVVANEDGTFDIVLPGGAKGKDVRATLTDKDGNPVDDGTVVGATDFDGNYRGTGKTQDGVVEFPNYKGETKEDGTTEVIDQKTDKSVTVTVYVADDEGKYSPIAGAKVTSNEDGSYDIDLPQGAKGKDVKVNLVDSSTGEPVAQGTVVSGYDYNGTCRGVGQTDEGGNVYFAKEKGTTTFPDGTTEVLDPKTNKIVRTTLSYDRRIGLGYEALADAVITAIKNDGQATTYSIELPDGAKGYSVKAVFEYVEGDTTTAFEAGVLVSATDNDGAYRGSRLTDSTGTVIFECTKGTTTLPDGTTDVVDPVDEELVEVTVEYLDDNGNWVPLADVDVEAIKNTSIDPAVTQYALDLPVSAKGKDVRATLLNKQTQKPVAQGTKVTATDANGNIRGIGSTDAKGQVVFSKSSTTTKPDGTGTLIDSDGKEVNVTVTLLDDSGNETGKVEGAQVTALDDGTYTVELPRDAKGQNVKVHLEEADGTPLINTTVQASDYDQNRRGTGVTDNNGDVVFSKNEGETDDKGKTDVIDQDNNTVIAKAYYELNYKAENYVALEGAHIKVDSSGNWTANLPQEAKGKNVKIQLQYADGNDYVVGAKVSAYDADSGNRGRETTDGEGWVYFTIIKIDFSKNANQPNLEGLVFNRQAQTPELTIVADGTTLVAGSDYIVSYSNNVNAGKATAKVSGMGRYYGSNTYEFNIARREITDVTTTATDLTYNAVEQYVNETSVVATGIALENTSKVTEYTVDGNHHTDSNYKAGIDPYIMTITGQGNFCGKQEIRWTIARKDIKDATVTLSVADQITYDTEVHTPTITSVKVPGMGADGTVTATLVLGTEYSNTTIKSRTHVGSETITVYGVGNFCGTKDKSWEILQKDINDSDVEFALNSTEFTYNGGYQGPSVSKLKYKNETLTTTANAWGSRYQVGGDVSRRDCGNYTFTVTGYGDYKGTISTSWKINQLSIKDNATITLDPNQSLVYDGSLQTRKIQSVKTISPSSLDVTYDVVNSSNKAENAGNYTLTIQGTGNFKDQASIGWNIEQATINSVTLQNYSLIDNGGYQSPGIASVKTTNGLDVPSGGYTIEGGSSNEVGDHTLKVTGQGNFKGSAEATWTIKANNKPTESTPFWGGKSGDDPLNPTDYVSPETIQEDAEKIRNDNDQATIDKWTEYMNNDFILYVRWNGHARNEAEKYVAFRVIHVGNHDNDGSAITFMATHSLPEAKQINYSNAAGVNLGWPNTSMYKEVLGSGGYVESGLNQLTPYVTAIDKVSITEDGYGANHHSVTTHDKFWILSNSEITQDCDGKAFYRYTNHQYKWFEGKKRWGGPQIEYPIASLGYTRAGIIPEGRNQSVQSCWLRDINEYINNTYAYVNYYGSVSYARTSVLQMSGVVPCFAF